jgi:hypothetical protein
MIEEKIMQPTLDDFTPKTRLQFPDGSILTVGTRRDDDDPLHYGVHLLYATGRSPEPEMSILLPPHAIDMLIEVMEDFANQARFVMGHQVVDYPPRPQEKKPKRKKPADKASKVTPKSKPDSDSSALQG